MSHLSTALLLVPDFALILLGYALCRFTALNRSVWEAIDRLVYFVLFPVLLFHSIVRQPIDVATAGPVWAAGALVAFSGIALAYSLPWWPGLRGRVDRRDHASAAQVAFRFNSFIGLAVVDRLLGPPGVQVLALLMGLFVPLFNVAAVWPMARASGDALWRELLRNPLIIATASALILSLLGFTLPDWVAPTTARIGAAAIAIGLMAAGAGMQWGSLWRGRRLSAAVLGIRHLLLPVVAAGAAWWMQLDPLQATVLMVFSALPTAGSAYVLAARMGYNGPYVAGLVTLSTLLGMLSLPLALALKGWVLGF
jgi:malonate transporter and related proteins